MKIFLSTFASILSAFLLAGCETRVASFVPQENTKYSIENTGKFALFDPGVRATITCTGLQERVGDGGRLAVVANIKNLANKPVQVQVRCIFKDVDGFTTGDETAWQTLALADEGTEAVGFTAANLRAHKYTVIVRSAP